MKLINVFDACSDLFMYFFFGLVYSVVELVERLALRRYIGTLDLGVLQDMDGIRKKAGAKWAREEVSFNKPLNLKPFNLKHFDLPCSWNLSELRICGLQVGQGFKQSC